VSESEAMSVNDPGCRWAAARGGAQAVQGALHADRRVQQYGLL